MPLRKIGGVRGNLVRDNAGLHVVAIRKPEMFFRCDVAKHGGAVPADHRRADGRRDVIVTRCDIRRERAERIEGGFSAPFELLFHVLFDEMHRHVTRSFVHHLDIVFPRDLCQLALRFQLGELRLVVCVGDRAWAQAITERE